MCIHFRRVAAKRKHLRFAHFFAVAFAFDLCANSLIQQAVVYFFSSKWRLYIAVLQCFFVFGTCIRQSSNRRLCENGSSPQLGFTYTTLRDSCDSDAPQNVRDSFFLHEVVMATVADIANRLQTRGSAPNFITSNPFIFLSLVYDL